VGIEVAKGNRGIYYDMLVTLLQEHRAAIASALESMSNQAVRRIEGIQVIDGSGIQDTIVGTCTQMLLGQNGIDPYSPLMAYTPSDRDSTIYKISARCSRLLLYRNIHMGKAMRKAALRAGGEGGGHAPACGAYIPAEHLDDFTQHFAELLSLQLGHPSG
jgi:single-stranded-DNA-specific exonuclease